MQGMIIHVNNVIIIPISFLWKNYDGIYLSVTDISDMIIDGVTYLDIVFSFRTGYVDSSNNIVTDLREIKLNYLKTWFFIDICSTFTDSCFFRRSGDFRLDSRLRR